MSGGKARRAGWAILPLAIWTVALVLLPMLYVLALSFSTRAEGYGVEYVFSLESYFKLFDESNLTVIFLSLRVAAYTTALTLLVGYPFAYILAHKPKKTRGLLLMLVIIPFWTSALLRTYGWMLFLRSNGILNDLLRAVGLIGKPLKLLYNMGAVLFGMAYSFLPFMILPVYSSLEKLDRSLSDAARDLGAGRARAFLTVTLPLTMPGVLSGCVMVFVPSVGLFFISDLMGGGTEMLLGNLINHYLHGGRNWPLGAALSMVIVLLTFLSTGIYRRYSDGGDLGVF